MSDGNNKDGRVMCTATLFLRAGVYDASSDGEHQYILKLLQRNGVASTLWTLIWMGDEADAFMRLHRSECKAGKALALTFYDPVPHRNEQYGFVQTCALAPDRWPARRADTQPQPTEENHS